MNIMFPLIVVQFLKESMLEELTAMVLVKEPIPIPSQAVGRTRPAQAFCLVFRFCCCGLCVGLYLWDRVLHTVCRFGLRSPASRTILCRMSERTNPLSPRNQLPKNINSGYKRRDKGNNKPTGSVFFNLLTSLDTTKPSSTYFTRMLHIWSASRSS